jgi:catechol 2,3-dioxygenase-like lactoylglutathione lyase family enzyme
MITGLFPTLCADDVAATRDFYCELFGFRVVFDSGWYVQLAAPDRTTLQIGIVERDHQSVPEPFRRSPSGVLVSIEVDDARTLYAQVQARGLPLPMHLRDEDFGQRHFMTVDPSGTLVDVITPIEPSAEYAILYDEDVAG